MRARRVAALLGGITLALALAVGVRAAALTLGPLVQVSGASPLAGCTVDDVVGQSGTSFVGSEVEPSIDVNPARPGEHRRDLAAGPLVERRRPRARRWRQRQRRHELDSCHEPEDDRVHRGHGGKRGRLSAGDRPVGLVRADGDRLPVEPVVQRRRASVHDVRLRPRAPGEPVDERRGHVERSGRGQARHGADRVQRQANRSPPTRPTPATFMRSGTGSSSLGASGQVSSPRSGRTPSTVRPGSRARATPA